MNSAFDISTSGLIAQRTRLDAISGNIANMSSLRNENGELAPYQARFVVFETDSEMTNGNGAQGVKVSSVETSQVDPSYRYQPDHPLAIEDGKWKGYVAYPSINMTAEMVNALEATRAYEANIGAMEISKSMGQQTLRILV
jgi:flagellar basal-body rod protein FlgC